MSLADLKHSDPTGEANPRMQARYRLSKNRQFQYVYRKGKGVSAPHMTLIYVRSGRLQAGFSVSKKLGNAVVRNRIKRRLREAFRLQIPTLHAGLYVFVARSDADKQPYAVLVREMNTLLRRLRLYKDSSAGSCQTGS